MTSLFGYKIDDETELHLIEPRHSEALNSLIEQSRDHVKEWSSWFKDDRSIENTHNFIKRNLKQFAANEGFAVGIWHRNEMAGQIEYNYLDWTNRKTEIGFWLGKSFQGKGLATKSCRVLIEHAFNNLKLNRVEMCCAVKNTKSRKIPEKLDFTEEGIICQAQWLHDHFVDLVIYRMLANDWRAKSNL